MGGWAVGHGWVNMASEWVSVVVGWTWLGGRERGHGWAMMASEWVDVVVGCMGGHGWVSRWMEMSEVMLTLCCVMLCLVIFLMLC